MTSNAAATFALLSSSNEASNKASKKSKRQRRFFRGFRRRSSNVREINGGQECDATTLSEELNSLDVDAVILPKALEDSRGVMKIQGKQVVISSYHTFLDYLLQRFGLTGQSQAPSTPTKKVETSRLRELVHQDFTHLVVDNPSTFGQDIDESTAILRVHLDVTEVILNDFYKFYTLVHDHNTNVTPDTCDGPSLVASSRQYQLVEACSPKMLRDVFLVVQDYIRPRLLDFAQTPANIACVIVWWEEQLYNKCFSGDGSSEMWRQIAHSWRQEDLEYLETRYIDLAICKHLRSLLERSVKTNHGPDDIRQNKDEHLVTGLPENTVVMIRSQIIVAKKHLPASYVHKVLEACNGELSRTVSDLMLTIETQWKTLGSSRFCAYINDAQRLADLLEELYEELEEQDNISARGSDDILQELAQLALHAAKFLSQRIVWDLRRPRRRFSRTTTPPLLSSVGSSEWETSVNDFNGTAVATTVATLQDYFKDIRHWLSSDFYYPKILKMSVNLTLMAYLESFFVNTMVNAGCNASVVSKSVQDDYLRFIVFFNGETFEEYFGRCGFYSQDQLNYHTHVLKSIGHILDPSNDPDDLVLDIKEVIREFASSGVLVTLHLAGMRKRRVTQAETEEWLQAIAKAEKALQLCDENEATHRPVCESLYSLPDLRNSKQVQKLKFANMKRMEMNVSLRSLQIVCETNKLLSAPRSVNRYLMAVSDQIVERLDRKEHK